jgi:RHS repeat-associated protein
MGLGLLADGTVLIADENNNRIRKLVRMLPLPGAGAFTIAAENGSAVYDFDGYGRHLRTREGLTGSTLLSFQYDAAGRLSSITDADSLVTTVERNAQGQPTAIVAPFGQRTVLTLDAAGYLASATNPANERVEPTHASTGLLSSFRDARGLLHQFQYDPRARLTRDDGPTGLFRTLAGLETDTSLTVTEQSALGRTWTYRMQRTGKGGMLSTRTDPAGMVTTSVSLPEVSDSTRLPGGATFSIRYGSDPRFGGQAPFAKSLITRMPSGLASITTASRRATLTSPTNPFAITTLLDSAVTNGRVYTAQYTGSTRVLVTTSPEGRQSFVTFDARGRVTQRRIPGLAATSISYDAQGRLREELRFGRRTTYMYGADGRLASLTNPRLRTTRFFYDSAGRVNRQESPDGRSVHFAYDAKGNLRSITPPGRPAHRFTYTSVNLTDTVAPPLIGQPMATVFAYNADRALTGVHRADGTEHVYGYDTPGRLTSITTPGGVAQFAYDSITGHIRTMTAVNGSTLAFTYDGLLPTREQWGGTVQGEVGLRYNANFLASSFTINGADTVVLQYDRDGLPTQVGRLTLGYHPQHGLHQSTALDSVTSSLTYDSLAQTQTYQVQFGATTLFNSGYQYDSLGRITRIDETAQGIARVMTFAYDTAGRLGEVRTDGVVTAAYEYDANGNRLRVVRPGGQETGTYDVQDRVTAYGAAIFAHLATGERSMRVVGTDTTRYEYDPFGRLLAVREPNGTRVEFTLDPRGRRVAKSVGGVRQLGFIYLGQLAPVAQLDAQNQVTARFVYGTRANVPDYMELGGATYRLVTDHLGSVRLVVNVSSGEIAQRLDYDEFGVVVENTNPGFQPFGYAGGLYDEETGISHFGARDYDPSSGRWLQPDPIGFASRSTNLYAYVENQPLHLSDPTGLTPWDVLDAISFLWSLRDFLCNPGWGTGFGVVADGVGLLPIIPALGTIRRADDVFNSLRHTDDQAALIKLVNEAGLDGHKPLSLEDAETVLDWAEEVQLPGWRAGAGDVGSPSNWTGAGGIPHIHIPGAGRHGHVPVEPGVQPRP